MSPIRPVLTPLLILVFLVLPALARDYYVSPNGSDAGGDGSQARPWRTIQRAADMMAAGDTCHVANGEYPEMARPARSGEPGEFISFVADGASVTLNGARQITGWTVHSGRIWKANVSWTFDELFIDRQRMVLARWPNLDTGDIYRPNFYQATANGGKTSIIDSVHLTQPSGYWDGAKIFLLAGLGWSAEQLDVAGYDPAQHRIDFNNAVFSRYYDADRYSLYFLYDKLSLLDAPSEWFLDRASGTIYLWTPDGGNPNSHLVESSGGTGGFDLTDRSYIRVAGFNLMSGDIKMRNAIGCLVEDIRHHFPAAELWVNGSDNVIARSEIAYASLTGVRLAGTRNTLSKCHVHHCNYFGDNKAIVELGEKYFESWWRADGGTANKIVDCSLHDTGGSGVTVLGALDINNCIIEHNEIYNAGLIAKDLGGFYCYGSDGGGSVIRYNIVHDVWTKNSPQYSESIRLGTGIYLDEDSSGFSVHHNAVYRTSVYAIMLHQASRNNLVYNNTAVGSGTSGAGWGDVINSSPGNNTFGVDGTVVANNLAVMFDDRSGWCINFVNEVPGYHHNGYFNLLHGNKLHNLGLEGTAVTGNPLFACVDGDNFSLLPGSPMIDKGAVIPGITDGYAGAAPDIGAYERGGSERPGPRDEWWLAARTLTVQTSAGGTTNPGPGVYSLKQNRSVCMTAIPDYRYTFANWTGDASGTSPSLLVTLDADKTIKANFQRLIYAPLNAAGQKILNRSLGKAEYINGLSWEAHPNNNDLNIVEYRIYQVDGTARTLLGTVGASAELKFDHRGRTKGVQTTYEITAVTADGREGEAASVTIPG